MSMMVNPFYQYLVGSDPLFSQVVVLLAFDGANGDPPNTANLASLGTSFTYPNNHGATLSTTSPQSGTACANFLQSGGAEYVTSTHSDYVIGTQDFTIEVSYWMTAKNDKYGLDVGDTASQTIRLDTYFAPGGGFFWECTGGNTTASSGTDITLNAWNSIALSRISNTLYWHNAGTYVGSVSNSHNFTGNRVTLGSSITGGFQCVCRLDNFRLTIGTGRYGASNYTPRFPFPTH